MGVLVLLLAWIVQFGAQLCALHCPTSTAWANDDAPPAVAVGLADDADRSLPSAASDCPLADVCDLGQTALLPVDRRPAARIAAADDVSAPPARAARFERAPEERPPTA
jgi:hypothetical protein